MSRQLPSTCGAANAPNALTAASTSSPTKNAPLPPFPDAHSNDCRVENECLRVADLFALKDAGRLQDAHAPMLLMALAVHTKRAGGRV